MGIVFIRTIILYIMLMIMLRIAGKRQIGELQSSELVVTILISDLAAIPMQDTSIPLLHGIIPIVTVICTEIIFSSLSLKSRFLRKAMYGTSCIVIKNGVIDQKMLKRLRMSLDDLLEELRLKDTDDFTKVDIAIVETNGTLSVFKNTQFTPPSAKDIAVTASANNISHTIISDGITCRKTLASTGHSLIWLKNMIKSHGAKNDKEIFYMAVNNADEVTVVMKNTPLRKDKAI